MFYFRFYLVLKVLSNFIPHETILCDDKDPPWFNSRIKSLFQAENKDSNKKLLNKLNFVEERLNGLITKSKNNHYERMKN